MTAVYLLGGFRTGIGKRGGLLSSVHPAELLGDLMAGTLSRLAVQPREVDQVIAGCVTTYGDQASNIARTAWLTAGLPDTVPGVTVDARCGSSQQAAHYAAGLIASGVCDVILCGGVEHMSRHPLGQDIGSGAGNPFSARYRDLVEVISQGESAERIAQRWGISREDCDVIALRSQERAAAATASGRLAKEIIAVQTVDANGAAIEVGVDQGPRPTTMDGLRGLKPAFRPDGVLTAGNSSQISDGACCAVLVSETWVREHAAAPLAEIAHQVLVGVDPVLKLTGPIPATARLLSRSGLTISDFDVAECNEAFASVTAAWQIEHKVDPEKVNVNGGAIALGHPVGMTGVRLLLTAAYELIERDGERALVTMCCGGGLGTATEVRRV
jgi:acetyl-CoA acetyltransferase family protein